MTSLHREGSAAALVSPVCDFSATMHSSASPARVDGWRQERSALATRSAPSGLRQGGPWGSTT